MTTEVHKLLPTMARSDKLCYQLKLYGRASADPESTPDLVLLCSPLAGFRAPLASLLAIYTRCSYVATEALSESVGGSLEHVAESLS